jgi:Aldehyde dehydrogenase family.
MKITTVNPATEEILAEYDAIPVEQVKDEVNDSRVVFNSIWKKFDISERSKLLRSLGHIFTC